MVRYGVGCCITGIYAGRVKDRPDGRKEFVGENTDVTREAIGAVAQWLLQEGIEMVLPKDGKKYILKVVEED